MHPIHSPIHTMTTLAHCFLRAAACISILSPLVATAGDFPKGSPAFSTNFAKARALQTKSGKPAVVIFSASWCGPCQVMKKKVYPSAEIKAQHANFEWVYLDADDATNAALLGKFSKEGSIPHIEFLSASGASLGKQVGSSEPKVFAQTLAAMSAKAKASKPAKR